MQTLDEWRYPDATMPTGASMSDGGNPLVPSVKCQAVLTTPDPIEKVIAFYSDRATDVHRDGQASGDAKASDPRTVSDQDDSQGRPVTVRVIVVNKAATSTTLVISRAKGEERTHIACLHYIRLGGKR
jgi:hypothetical protein